MKKITRLTKAWHRNWEFFIVKGIYFCNGCVSVKYWPTPKQLNKWLKKEK